MRPALPWFLKETKSPSWSSRRFSARSFGLWCLPFLALGLFCLWSLSLRPTLDWMQAQSWQPVDVVIEKAQVRARRTSRGGTTHDLEVQFSYQYDGAAHTGTRHSFGSSSIRLGVTGMQKVVASLPPGKKVIAWANPQNPAESVLDRSWPAETASHLFIPMPFITLGMTGLFSLLLPLLRRKFRASRQAQLAGLVATGRLPPWILRAFTQTSQPRKDGVALVTAADERLTQMVRLLFFNLFWNGLVGAFVWAELVEIVPGGGGKALFVSFILTPFVAVSFLLLWMLMTHWRCQRRPQWVAAVHPVPGFGGGTVQCCWAWLEEGRSPHPPQAVVRVVAQAAHWSKKFNRPAVGTNGIRRRKLLSPGTWRKGQRELCTVEIPIHSAAGEISVTLPQVPSLRAETAKQPCRKAPTTWCRWWQMEVTYADGKQETVEVTRPAKLN